MISRTEVLDATGTTHETENMTRETTHADITTGRPAENVTRMLGNHDKNLLKMIDLATATHMIGGEVGPGMVKTEMEDTTAMVADAIGSAMDGKTKTARMSGLERRKRHENSRPCRALQTKWTRIAASGWPRLRKRTASPEMRMRGHGNAMAIEHSRMDCTSKRGVWILEPEWDATSTDIRETTIEAKRGFIYYILASRKLNTTCMKIVQRLDATAPDD